MSPRRPVGGGSRREQHIEWLKLIEVSGPFLSVPVLTKEWPDLEPLDAAARATLRQAHGDWQSGGKARDWITFILADFLGWGDNVAFDGDFSSLALEVPEHEAVITPSFTLTDSADGSIRLLGMITDGSPVARVRGSDWPATPADRLAHLCRARGVELGLATDGRWWALVWAPAGGVTTVAVFDAVAWPDSSERTVVRAFTSLLQRRRWFAVPADRQLTALLRESLKHQEDITERLGVQVRQAVEMLVAAFAHSGAVSDNVTAAEVYRGAVTVMMRLVFLLFAEEALLLPADNPLYASAYSAGSLYSELEQRVADAHGNEAELDHTHLAWHRLLALFNVVYRGVSHPELKMIGHDGSLFDPARFTWFPLAVDDRTVLHMLRSVQTVTIAGELRTVSFRTLTVEQIGYVYEGLLSFEGFRAADVVVGLIGKEGREEEVPLSAIEALGPVAGLPEKLSEKYKDSGIGSVKALTAKLAPLSGEDEAQARSRLYAVVGDHSLVQRLLPYYGIIRRDLRGDPVVILPGQLYVTESKLRASTGTHYTPRFLAEQVAEGALEPLVYSPGPLQTADRSQWTLRKEREILSLKIADIAMGSGAFLVAACRYLAGKLIEAWSHEGNVDALRVLGASPVESGLDLDIAADPLVIKARRAIIEHCLYGVDINEMAVEMAKLSLWLVSMDPLKPFTFLDDKLACGDSLLGITSIEQLEWMHLRPADGRKLHEELTNSKSLFNLDFLSGVRRTLTDVAEQRRILVDIPDDLDGIIKKREILSEVRAKTTDLSLYADLITGTALSKASWAVAAQTANAAATKGALSEAQDEARKLLAWDQPDGAFDRDPLHWPLMFPEVFGENNPGFDSIIGNPPFLGGNSLSGDFGEAYREYAVRVIAGGARGSADLLAYFVCRIHQLMNTSGSAGLVAKSTLAEGVNKSISLDRLTVDGIDIFRATSARPWPAKSADIRYCGVWTSKRRREVGAPAILDGSPVGNIDSSLASIGVHEDAAPPLYRLAKNISTAFQGAIPLGEGFEFPREEAILQVSTDPTMSAVLYPYLDGDDLNNRFDLSAARWIINFHDWPEERAKQYPLLYAKVLREVKPERDGNNRKARKERWWQYGERAAGLYRAIYGLETVIAIARVSSTVAPTFVASRQVFHDKVVVFASNDSALLALLSSSLHYWWVTRRTTRHGGAGDITYAHKLCFETFPCPDLTSEMRTLGDHLDTFRRELMLAKRVGLTAIYNLVHSSTCTDVEIVELRAIHRAIDEAATRAYGWADLLGAGLGHGFHGTRYTIAPTVRQEILDRLLELNHARHEAEVKVGLHAKKPPRRGAASANSDESALF